MALGLNNQIDSAQVQDLANEFDSSSNHSDSRLSADDHEDDLQKCKELDEENDTDVMDESQEQNLAEEDDHQFHIEDGIGSEQKILMSARFGQSLQAQQENGQ